MSTRTTLTLDDDVAADLARVARASGRPLKAVVNDALRAGLDPRRAQVLERLQVAPSDMGLRRGIELDSISNLLERIEGPQHR